MLSQERCHTRQGQFRERLSSIGIDTATLKDYRDLYDLTDLLFPERLPAEPCLTRE